MHTPLTLLIFLLLLFTTTISACKCIVHRHNNVEQTEYCCQAHVQGVYDADKQDCEAQSIAEKMRGFSYCCWLRTGVVGSDCKH